MKLWYAEIALLAAMVLLNGPALGAEKSPQDALDAFAEEIDSFSQVRARELLNQLDKKTAQSARGKYLTGRLLFFEGDMNGALKKTFEAIELSKTESNWKAFRDRVIISRDVAATLTPIPSKDGNILFYVANDMDKILLSYAEKALSIQLDELEKILGDKPDLPFTVMLLPNVESLAGVSGLTVEQIERTGTVGITKYGRVMIVTPRALATGYPWLDTLAHELTHAVITRVSRNKAPIWFHEGLAKLLERRWRHQFTSDLTPEEAYLLDRAVKERRLIPLRRFHPSIAYLPNHEDAALAYAQVLSFFLYLNGRFEKDPDWLRTILISLSRDESMDQAFVKISKFNVLRLYNWWQQTISGRRQTPVPAIGLMKKRFKRGATIGQAGSETMLDPQVRSHVRLGDLLRLRGHIKSAAIEYKTALSLSATTSLEISDRLGGCLLELGKYADAIALLKPVTALYPSHSTVFVQLGEALAANQHRAEATKAFEQAAAINPFHPNIHCQLSKLYNADGQIDRAEKELEYCHLLASRPSSEER